MRPAFVLLAACLASATLAAAVGPPVDIPTRARGAERIVVATIVDVQPSFEQSIWGDQLIVSHALLQVEETMKGPPAAALPLDVEGGTVGDLTLRVSDLPTIKAGERAVFFLDRRPSGAHLPHGRGLGILKLDAANRVEGSDLTLDDVREMVQAALKTPGR